MNCFKCKMCGGTIEFEQGATVGVCDSCGTKQTLPKTSDDVITNLFNRANNLRLKCEFDKAAAIYEKIVEQDDSEAEAHWGIVLCKYGIEYVDDPASGKKIPTCHRTLFEAVTSDADYQAAIDYSDATQQYFYESEGHTIDRIQKDILSIAKNEKPFDVFICYKETDENGKRTQDSAIANDIYYQLTQEGFKVFYSAVTLEDKLGQEYEPYIFAALNSAKVMLVIGTNPVNFNAVWVKNEWSRYLKLMKSDRSKLLIPCYRDMDAYELPEEFSHLMAQDMSKIGFINDIVRGIKKVLSSEIQAEPVKAAAAVSTTGTGNTNTANTLERAFQFLEDGKWQEADNYCEKLLDDDPKNAEAHLVKLMIELKVKNRGQLADCAEPFDDHGSYSRAIRYGSAKLQEELKGYIEHINERNENARLTAIYNNAQTKMQNAKTSDEYREAADLFESITGFKDSEELNKQCTEQANTIIYEKAQRLMQNARTEEKFKQAAEVFNSIAEFKDSKELATQCIEKAEDCRKDAIYDRAKFTIKSDLSTTHDFAKAILLFETIPEWKDADEQICFCRREIERIKREEDDKRKADEIAEAKEKKAISIGMILLAAILVIVFLVSTIVKSNKYNHAMGLIDSGDYESAYALLEETGYSEEIASNKYDRAIEYIETGNYESAYALLEEIGNTEAIASSKYDRAIKLMQTGDYDSAMLLLEGLSFRDSEAQLASCYIGKYGENILNSIVGDTISFGSYEQDNDTSNGVEPIEWKVIDKEGKSMLLISDKALDVQPYNTSYAGITWETSTLRKWLNETFLTSAFSPAEQAIIQVTTVTADKCPNYITNPGNETSDKVFILSISDAEEYFESDQDRICMPTKYAISKGANSRGSSTCWWWLRSPGATQYCAEKISNGGSIFRTGISVDQDDGCVRPVIWINLGS